MLEKRRCLGLSLGAATRPSRAQEERSPTVIPRGFFTSFCLFGSNVLASVSHPLLALWCVRFLSFPVL